MKKNIFLLSLSLILFGCQSRPTQPAYMGNTETQESTHLFTSDYETVFNAVKDAFSKIGLSVKKADNFGKYITANRNSGKGFTTSTVSFYPVSNGVRVRIVSKSNAANKNFAELNEKIIQFTGKRAQ
jgi:hypothetical protein